MRLLASAAILMLVLLMLISVVVMLQEKPAAAGRWYLPAVLSRFSVDPGGSDVPYGESQQPARESEKQAPSISNGAASHNSNRQPGNSRDEWDDGDVPDVEQDPVLALLGQPFGKIERALGEPSDAGYGSLYGPHNYILYSTADGDIRFCSPEILDEPRAISIIMRSGGRVLNVDVGMSFSEIEEVLGPPDYGPDSGTDGVYYADYIIDSEVYISFSAPSIDGPTEDAFIKLKDWSE